MLKQILHSKKWVIMSTDRTVIATGNPRNRRLTKVEDAGNVRILTYTTQGKAKSAYSNGNGFWEDYKDNYNDPDLPLEPVLLQVTYSEVVDD